MTFEHNGIEISVHEKYGTFMADIDGITLHADSLKECQAKIETEMKARARMATVNLPCFVVLSFNGNRSCCPATLIGLSRTDSSLRFKGIEMKAGQNVDMVLPDNDDNMVLAQNYAAVRNRLNELDSQMRKYSLRHSSYGGRI